MYLFGTLSVFLFLFFFLATSGVHMDMQQKKKKSREIPIYKLVAHIIIILTIIVVIFYFVTRPEILLRSDQCGSRSSEAVLIVFHRCCKGDSSGNIPIITQAEW